MSLTNKIVANIKKTDADVNTFVNTTNVVCIDTSNNRIGINTKTPRYSIDIIGSGPSNMISVNKLLIENIAIIKDISCLNNIDASSARLQHINYTTISGNSIISKAIVTISANIIDLSISRLKLNDLSSTNIDASYLRVFNGGDLSGHIIVRKLTVLGDFSGGNSTSFSSLVIANSSLASMTSTNSYIQNILGNYNNTTDINNSKFADGVYLLSCNNVNLYNNLFNNIIRIGIALEGEINQDKSPKFIGSKVKIYNNKFFLMQQSRGTEHNAGIWIEPTKNNTNFIAKYINIDIENNKIDNLNSIIGKHYQYGIFNGGNNVIIKNNQITNYINKNSIGIKCLLDCSKIIDNYFINNNVAYSINQLLNKQEVIQDKKYELLDNQNSYTNNLYNKLFFD